MPICPICGEMMGKPTSMAVNERKPVEIAEAPPEETTVAAPDTEPYALLTNRELAALIDGRPGLAVPKRVNKDNLIAVLMADDAQV